MIARHVRSPAMVETWATLAGSRAAGVLAEGVSELVGFPRAGVRPTGCARGWFKKSALQLVRLLRMRKQPWNSTVRAVHRLLKLAGYGDGATEEKIRRYIRDERERDPKFGGA